MDGMGCFTITFKPGCGRADSVEKIGPGTTDW
jgi:hypothetical protein